MILQDRLAEVLARPLLKGGHNPDGEMCVMEAAAYIAGEKWSAAPQCVCPAITDFMVPWNDCLPTDADRDRLLKPLLPLLIGTRTTTTDTLKYRWMAFDWLVREHAPAWMDLTPSLVEHATALRGLPEITANTIALAMPVLQEARKASAAAGDAAGDAAGAAARAAAGAAARAAAGDAAGDAAENRLAPTVAQLQASAQDLVRRMCAVGVA